MSEPRTFRLTVAYDGTRFHGWQKQPGLRTVQGDIESAARDVLGNPDLVIHGAGRTDRGVHARGQVASLVAATSLPAHGLGALVQRLLARDVRVVGAAEMPRGFHARHSACARRYAYRLLDAADVLYGRFAWVPHGTLDGEALARSVLPLLGEHDFSAFGATGSSPVNPVCRVLQAGWSRWEAGWRFDVTADHFLYHMVRNLVATSLRAQRVADPADHVRAVLASRDRARSGATAPAHALCLEAVSYDPHEQERVA